MKIILAIIGCEGQIESKVCKMLSALEYETFKFNSISDLKYSANQIIIIICPIEMFENNLRTKKHLPNVPYLLISKENKFIKNKEKLTIDCILFPFTKEQLSFRVQNLISFQKSKLEIYEQHEKLRKYFDKSRKKTIDLFGKHIDLKKAQKEIEYQNVKLEQTIDKKKYKTIELFGKHIDLKKAKKEIDFQKSEIERQNEFLERILEKKKRKTIDLFAKHLDLKLAKKDLIQKKEILEKVLEKNKQKTLDLFAKHIDLKKAKKEIHQQKNQIEKQNQSITDSIKYAGFIQSAVLPREEYVKEVIPKHLIIYEPRDIVSGDFYWMEKIDDILYIIAADCTGHGVPGAFMSMLGISLLNELVNRYKNKKANQIMELLRDKVIFSLHQTGRMDEAADGMDLSFCIINTKNYQMQFSGAHNPVYIIRKNELIEIKGDRMPIGFSLRINKPFTNHDFDLQKGDKIYMFSDGFADQFGGEHGMKMRYKVFQQHLIEAQKLDFEKQHDFLMDKYTKWKGEYNQIDDILVLGFEVE